MSTACADTTLPAIAWFCGNAGSRTQGVGTRAANTWGLFDMLGNVWEWTWDAFEPYPPTAVDPTGPASGSDRILRGGSWSINALDARAAFRFYTVPAFRDSSIGFRLARTLP